MLCGDVYRCKVICKAIALAAIMRNNWLDDRHKYSLVESTLLKEFNILIDSRKLKAQASNIKPWIIDMQKKLTNHVVTPQNIEDVAVTCIITSSVITSDIACLESLFITMYHNVSWYMTMYDDLSR
jgi:hypothetical protein